MPGTDLDAHALAADIKNLSKDLRDMRDENRAWREKQLAILNQLSENKETTRMLIRRCDVLERRLDKADRSITSLTAWKYWQTGILAGVIGVFEFLKR
ncbi:MAG: hypothetical protein IKW49_01770 [Opitutales bacterium]|nr:hypothetical protein [Opitutales bacterium]